MKFLPVSEADRTGMLAAIGASSVDALFVSIPAEVRRSPELPPLAKDGVTDASQLEGAVDETTFAVAVQSPNFLGLVEDWNVASSAAKAKGAMSVAVVAEAVSLALLSPPAAGGADIACGEAQSLGVPMHNGGPLLGFLACRAGARKAATETS